MHICRIYCVPGYEGRKKDLVNSDTSCSLKQNGDKSLELLSH